MTKGYICKYVSFWRLCANLDFIYRRREMDKETFKNESEKLRQTLKKMEDEEEHLNNTLLTNTSIYSKNDYVRAHLIYLGEKKLKELQKMKPKPYFARLDFKEKNEQEEKLYIGKLSLIDNDTHKPIIIDWRAPIANLYYDGRIGKAEYKCLNEVIEGDILLKRQFIIENGKLEKYSDIDLTTNDELLQEALGQNADSRLKNIVSTIQGEQNKIIRANMFKPLIVQGVAGSGKTTIALHRIAYLIYNYEKEFNPDEFMIIAPNRFFLNYISEILPDLGVENVKQYTFEDFAYEVIGEKLKITDENEKLVQIVNDKNCKNKEILINESKFKSSINFKKIIDSFLMELEESFLPVEDFCIENHTIMKYDIIQNLFKNKYSKNNFVERILKIKTDLIFSIKKESQMIIEKIKNERTKKIENLYNRNLDEDEIRTERIKIFEEKEKILKILETKPEKLVDKYIKSIKRKKGIDYYYDFIKNYIPKIEIDEELKEYIVNNTLSNLKKKNITYEDLAPIIYLEYKINGSKISGKLSHIVIDEAQDYGEFQFDVLKTVLNSTSMTILGDLSQGIHYYRGIENWNRFMEVEFKNENVEFRVLSKTYRTTKEIMNLANSVISKLPEYEKESIVLGEPVIDIKNCINICKCENKIEIIDNIKQRINEYKKAKYKSIAIIGKSKEECEYIYKELNKTSKDVNIIKDKDAEYNAGISIVPSYLAKGLEFDCVIIFNANEENYKENSLDIKILYVVITRAMSKLDIFFTNTKSKLLLD
jgi:DNA helicase II / ATP-dependent DNA helicase PcrA